MQKQAKLAKGEKMSYKKNNIIPLDIKKSAGKKTSGKRYVRSIEYEMLANLTLQQFNIEDEVDFEQLLSIPLENRIPGLAKDYGNKRTHRLIKLVLQEFCASIDLPKSKKLTETKVSVCACDLMIAGHEDQLALEDLIVFFERAKKGKYGPFKKVLTHFSIMEKLDVYRDERYHVYKKLKDEKQVYLKGCGPIDRMANEPEQIGELLKKATVIDLNKRKSS
jgi:hypothetical protein